MGPLAASVLLLVAGAITPGPNNLLMLRIGLESGMRAALLPATGVVLGGLAMLFATYAGVAMLIVRHTWVRVAILTVGAVFVAWLALRMIWDTFTPSRSPASSAGRAGAGVAPALLLQFVNPKSWLLVLTITAAGVGGTAGPAGRAPMPLMTLVLLFTVIPFVCLLLWAGGGALVARLLRHARARAWFERAVALLLLMSALIFVGQI